MTNFEYAVARVLGVEQGYVDNPVDRGGPTNFGITLKTLSRFTGSPSSVEDITRDDAIAIYKKLYWDEMQLDRIPKRRLTFMLLDQGVNSGTFTTIEKLQECLNALGSRPIIVDGVLGEATEFAVLHASTESLCRKLLEAFQIRYVNICQKDPTQLVFLEGWLRRTFRYYD